MANVEEKILDIQVRYDDAIRGIAKYQSAVDAARKHEKDLKKQLEENEISREQYNAEMAATRVVIQENNEAIRVLNKEIQNNRKVEKENEGSLKSLRAELSNLTAQYDALGRAEREGAEGKELQDRINAITNELKGAEEETQRFYRNVGNYKESILEAARSNVPFVDKINEIATSVRGLGGYLDGLKNELSEIVTSLRTAQTATVGMTTAQAGLTTTMNLCTAALKIFKVALISTGIGAIVVALGSLVSYLSRTQEGIELANKVMGALGATINVIIDRASKLGSALVNLFTGNFKEAADDAKNAFTGIGEEIAEESRQAWALADALNEIEKREVMLSMSRSANRAEIEKLKKAADDTTLSTKERIKAAEQAAKLEQEDLKIQTELAEARLANTLGFTEMNDQVRTLLQQIKDGDITADEVISQLGLSESTIDDLRTFSEQFNTLQELMEESYGRQTEQQNTLNSIRQEAADAAIAAKEKELEAVRNAEDAMLALVKDGREKQRKEIELQYSREIEDLQVRLDTEKDLTAKAREAINQQIKALEQQKGQELQKLSDEELQKEIENRQKLIELQLESVKEGSEQEYQLKMQQLIANRDAELAEKELTEQMKVAITDKYNKQIDDLSAQHDAELLQKQQDAIRLRYETEIAMANGNEQEILRIRLEQKENELNSIHQLEGESIEAFNLRKIELENDYLNEKQKLADKEVEIETKKATALSSLAGNLSALLEQAAGDNKEMAQLAKMLAIAEVAIAQGVAIAQAVKTATSSSATWIDMLAAIGTVVAAVTSVMATATKSINSAKFATGGLVTGPGTGTSDSIPARLSNGESVMTAAATSMFAPMLSAFNQLGGGIPINVTASSNQALGEDMLARAVAKGMMMAPPPIVSIEEFNSVANRVKYVENLGDV